MPDREHETESSPDVRAALGGGEAAADWKEKNREALDYARRWVEEHGVPFARHQRI